MHDSLRSRYCAGISALRRTFQNMEFSFKRIVTHVQNEGIFPVYQAHEVDWKHWGWIYDSRGWISASDKKPKNKKGKKIDSNTSIRLYTCSVHFQFFCPVSPISIGFTGSGSTDPVLKGRSALGGPHHFDLKRAGFPSSSRQRILKQHTATPGYPPPARLWEAWSKPPWPSPSGWGNRWSASLGQRKGSTPSQGRIEQPSTGRHRCCPCSSLQTFHLTTM